MVAGSSARQSPVPRRVIAGLPVPDLLLAPVIAPVIAFTAALVLGACSVQPTQPPSPAPPEVPEISPEERWEQRRDALYAVQEWRLRGKVGYRLPDDAGSASLHWRQLGPQSELRLSGPLGTGSTQIRNEGALLRVSRDGIARLYPADAAPWLPGGTLLPVPIDSIRYWLKGLPDPNHLIDALMIQDALAREIRQNGWNIRIDDYRDVSGLALPARLTLESLDTDLRLTLILREWTLGP
jgi:outer membrane lipoprotein LolB